MQLLLDVISPLILESSQQTSLDISDIAINEKAEIAALMTAAGYTYHLFDYTTFQIVRKASAQKWHSGTRIYSQCL